MVNTSLKSRLSVEYGWNDSVVDKMIEAYGEDYLKEREDIYTSFENNLEDHQINEIRGITAYCISKHIMVVRIHGNALESILESLTELYKYTDIMTYSLGIDSLLKVDLIIEVLEVEAMLKQGRIWHKIAFGFIKALPKLPSSSSSKVPKELRGETVVVGFSGKRSTLALLVDIERKSTWTDPVMMDINSLKEGIEYLEAKQKI